VGAPQDVLADLKLLRVDAVRGFPKDFMDDGSDLLHDFFTLLGQINDLLPGVSHARLAPDETERLGAGNHPRYGGLVLEQLVGEHKLRLAVLGPDMYQDGPLLRPDLYFRLQVIQITIPPLRERKGDIPLLAMHFLEAGATEHGRPMRELGSEVIETLKGYNWPGNVRELKNTMDRLVILGREREISLDELPPLVYAAAGREPSLEFLRELPPGGITLCDVQRELIFKTLQLFDGNRSFAAKALGISRKSLYERMERFNIS